MPPLRYKSLKKYLKFRLLNNEVNGNAVGQDAMEKEKEFLRLIYTQLKEVDRWGFFLFFTLYAHSVHPETTYALLEYPHIYSSGVCIREQKGTRELYALLVWFWNIHTYTPQESASEGTYPLWSTKVLLVVWFWNDHTHPTGVCHLQML
jgi:hypothetical protein